MVASGFGNAANRMQNSMADIGVSNPYFKDKIKDDVSARNIDRNFSQVRLFSILSITASALVSGYVAYTSSQNVARSSPRWQTK